MEKQELSTAEYPPPTSPPLQGEGQGGDGAFIESFNARRNITLKIPFHNRGKQRGNDGVLAGTTLAHPCDRTDTGEGNDPGRRW